MSSTIPEAELEELASLYEAKGLSSETARKVAEELTEHDAFAAHAEAELASTRTSSQPWQAAGASAISFTVGAILPMLAILLPPATARIPSRSWPSWSHSRSPAVSAPDWAARAGPAPCAGGTGGALAMAVTYGIGQLLGVAGV